MVDDFLLLKLTAMQWYLTEVVWALTAIIYFVYIVVSYFLDKAAARK